MHRTTQQRLLALLLAALGCLFLGFARTRDTASGQPPAAKAKVDTPKEPGLVWHADLTYCQAGKDRLLLDIARPERGAGPFPAVVILHGIGPLTKERPGVWPLAKELARHGYVGVSVGFRYKPAQHPFPTAIEDVKCAVRWLRAHASKYRIDRDRVGALGFSGGGGLACLLGMATPADGLEGNGGHADQPSHVRAVIAYCPPTDLSQLHEECCKPKSKVGFYVRGWMRTSLEEWLGGPPDKVARCYAQASPVRYARKDIPPLLLLHGMADNVVPFEQSRLLADRLATVGAKVNFLSLSNAGHDFDERPDANGRLAARVTLAFLDEHLKGVPARR